MNATKLTARQIETIRHIHDFMARNGLPPSIGELKRALGLASDQGVIEILQRLEDRGMVERTSGQARGLRLTAQACLEIGVEPIQGAGGAGMTQSGARQFELNPQQQRIFKRLADIDPKLARMYEGGLRVLLDESNPERIPLSAHSIRESTYHLSNMGKELLTKEEEAAAKAREASNARQLEKLFDPQGGVSGFGPTLYDTWNLDFQRFFVAVSHHGREVTLDEYREKLSQFEDFLSRYVLPLQVEIYARLDDQFNGGPENAKADELRALLSRNVESYRYFYRKADARWLGYLSQQNLIFPKWEVADYLARIAPEASGDVMAIIERMETGKDDWATRKGLIDAAAKMPPMLARRLIDKMDREKWLAEPYIDWLVHSLDHLVELFISSSQHGDALRVVALLTQHSAEQERLKAYHYGKVLKRFSNVPAAELSPYVRLLVQSLATIISRELSAERGDRSSWWRPAIEDHDQNVRHGQPKDILVVALRDALGRYVDYLVTTGQQNVSAIVDDLLKWDPPYSVFTRFKLHLYGQNAAHFMPQIEAAVIEQFDEDNAWHEYFLLVARIFGQLTKATQVRYLELVDRGPNGEHDEHYPQHWKARKLSAALDYLSPAALEHYQAVVTRARSIEHPDLLSYHKGGWVGSPVSEADLAGMPLNDLLDLLASWTPPDEIFTSSSRTGMGNALSKVVGKNSEAFSKEAHRFLDARIRPVYVYYLLSGLHAGLNNKAQLNWEKIIALAAAIVKLAVSGTLPTFTDTNGHDSWETEWSGVFQEIGALIGAGLNSSSIGPQFNNRGEIWTIIEFLCEHPDPTLETDKDADLATRSLNTIRGWAFRAAFAYIFWCDRHLNGKGEQLSRIPQEAKALLELHLDPAHDPSLTVRSVYGEYFRWLFAYDPQWATALIQRVFPIDDLERRYASWETYLANGLFPALYKALKPQYEKAISEVRNFKPGRRFWADPIEGLAVHVMVAYAYREEEEKGATWLKFFRVANPKQRGKAVSFAGTAFVQRDADRTGETPPDTNRLQEFWEWRLKESKDVDELKEFGWWIREGKFNDEWMLQRLMDTLVKTDGDIEADFQVLSELLVLAPQQPLLCAKALSLMVRSKSADRLMLGHNEDLPRILAALYATNDAGAIGVAENVIDHLTKLGFEGFRTIPQVHRKPVEAQAEGQIVHGGRQ